MPSIVELDREIKQKTGEMERLFEKRKLPTGQYDFSVEELAEIELRNAELAELGTSYRQASGLHRVEQRQAAEAQEQKRRGAPPMPLPENRSYGADRGDGSRLFEGATYKDVGLAILEGKAVKGWTGSANSRLHEAFPTIGLSDLLHGADMKRVGADGNGYKTLMTTSAGWAPEVTRSGRVVLSAQEEPAVADLMPQSQTEQAGVKFLEETTYGSPPGSNATEVAEGAAKPEAALALTERLVQCRKVAVWVPVTDEQLADVPQSYGYISNRLTLMTKQRLDQQLIQGTGADPYLQGVLTLAGTNPINAATDPIIDAIGKGINAVRTVGKASASGILLHPADQMTLRLLRTADGNYIWGHPSEAGPSRIFGLPVVASTFVPQGTAIVGDFSRYSELVTRQGIEIDVTNSHQDFFIKNQTAIRCELRCVALWLRAAAFSICSNIPPS